MPRRFTLEHWPDDGWYVGRLKEIPGVGSQGEHPDAYQRMTGDRQERAGYQDREGLRLSDQI